MDATPPSEGPQHRRPRQSLKYQLKGLLSRNREGSHATRRRRGQALLQFFRELTTAGLKLQRLSNLRPKHIVDRIQAWTARGLSPATMKTHMSHLRWLCEKLDKLSMVPSNDELGIPARTTVSGDNKAWPAAEHARIFDAVLAISPRLHMQMQLMESFGLRFKEAALLRPHESDLKHYLHVLHGTKGRRPRAVKLSSPSQRELLDAAKREVGPRESLVPPLMTFERWRKRADAIARRVGMSSKNHTNFHGLRHGYAQRRYQEEAGQESPCVQGERGGAAANTAELRQRDQDARLQVSEELGHGRVGVSSIYLGSPWR